ncbi:hypothetical protein NM208_g1695 [Fusarium decemcellulare]|uniref:Uncharacterized protein n=1 Tax=Fusarium decemcellulare TaxID=57161 RepID=A0ACC1SVD3_9HYPO|nr:hypothetical protein NM208_g1695 [Fusarium decemcellulare]
MPASLQTCPEDVVESIVQRLSLDDICNLRLTCKPLAASASHHSFRTYFETKHAILVPDTLQSFVQGLQAQDLRSLVQNLHLVAIVNEPPLDNPTLNQDPETERLLLRQAFLELARHAKDGVLTSLTLRLDLDYDLDNRRSVRSFNKVKPPTRFESQLLNLHPRRVLPTNTSLWRCAISTFDMVMQELATTRLKIKKLDMTYSWDPEEHSLYGRHLDAFDWSGPGLAQSLSTLESLSVRISTRRFPYHNEAEMPVPERTNGPSRYPGISDMIQLCPQLKSLNVHCVSLHSITRTRFNPRTERILQCLNELETLPRLKRFAFHHACTKAEDLMNFIQRTKVRELSMQCIGLTKGSWKPIFEYLTSQEAAMTKLSLNRLLESRREVGVVHFGQENPEDWVAHPNIKLELRGDALRHPIAYLVAIGPHISSLTPWQLKEPSNSLE